MQFMQKNAGFWGKCIPTKAKMKNPISSFEGISQPYQSYGAREVLGIKVKTFTLAMKLYIVLLFTAITQIYAEGNSQSISLRANGMSLKKVFEHVEKQTGYTAFGKREIFQMARPISIHVDGMPLKNFLDQVFKDQPLSYRIEEKNIILLLRTKKDPEENQVEASLPLNIDTKGRVVDTEGKPIAGASVQLKSDRKKGSSSNVDGYFEIKDIDENAVLIVSGINIESREIKVSGKIDLGNIVVQLKVQKDEEVVISTGYWETTKKLSTGNVSKITAKDIEKQPVTNVITALQGRVAGLDIVETGGFAGSSIEIRIRGRNSIAGINDPLFVVDGVPYSSESLGDYNVSRQLANGTYGVMSALNTLNGADIESIEVLKDADATAIYGSRGANGVILITTKKGKSGKTRIQFNMNGGVNNPTRIFEMLNTEEYVKMRKDAYRENNMAIPANAHDINGNWDTTRYTNWGQQLIGRPASRLNTQLSVNGGSEYTQFLISGSFMRQQPPLLKGYDFNYNKASVHLNVNHRSENKKFNISLTSTYSTDFNNAPGEDITRDGIFLPPNAPWIFKEDGSLNWETGFNNPVAKLNAHYESTSKSLNSNLSLGYKFTKNLEFNSNFGFNEYSLDEYNANSYTTLPPSPTVGPERSVADANRGTRSSWIIEPKLTWKKDISKGRLEVMIGSTIQQTGSIRRGEKGTGFPSDDLIYDLKSAKTFQLVNSSHTLYKYNAVYGRLNYNWESKYLINFTGRHDGSSRFGPGKQFANFGAIGAAWIFTEEKFLANQEVLSYGKLRASYGITGSDQIGDYEFLDTYSIYGQYGTLGGLIPNRHFNAQFGWEENKKLEFGLEFGFLKDRIMGGFFYYQNRSGNQLVGMPLPYMTGFNTVRANMDAVVENKGLEIELSSKNITNKNFSWNTNFNFSLPKNKLISYPGIENSAYATKYVVGKSLNYARLLNYTGIDPVSGLYTFEDVNKDGKITLQDDAYHQLVTGIKYTAAMGHIVSYKNFQLDMFFQYVNQTRLNFIYSIGAAFGASMSNYPKQALDNWSYNKVNPTYQKLTVGDRASLDASYNLGYSTESYKDASFLRLKNIALNYNIPKKWMGLEGKIYVQGQNLLTFSEFLGSDPEGGHVTYMPILKTYNFGLQINF